MASTTREVGSPQRHHVGEHWSGANPVPTVQKFMEHLDHEKKDRDRRIDQEKKRTDEINQQKKRERKPVEGQEGKNGDVMTHQAREVSQAKMRTVTDPTTGKEIGVEDQDEDSMEAVKDPKVRMLFRAIYWVYLADLLVVECSECQPWTTNRELPCEKEKDIVRY